MSRRDPKTRIAFMVDPSRREITAVNVDPNRIHEWIGLANNVEAKVTMTRLPTADFVCVDEHAWITPRLCVWNLVMYDKHPLVGAGIIIGDAEYAYGNVTVPEDRLRKWIKWTDLEATGERHPPVEKLMGGINATRFKELVDGPPKFRKRQPALGDFILAEQWGEMI